MNTSISIQDLENQAVDAAIRADWESAVDANKQIIDISKNNVQAHLRLGFAYLQCKKLNLSLDHYKKVLAIQPQNMIAADYVEKIKLQKSEHKKPSETNKLVLNPQTFVELPGKTKSVGLIQLGQKNVLASLIVGEQVYLSIRKRHVEIRTESGEYAGILPDDVGTRLMYFLENDSVYHVFVQEATLNNVSVFIREISKGKKVEKMASFPLDIPGSLSRVIAQQHQDEIDGKKGSNSADSDKSDPLIPETGLEDDEEEDDDDEMGDDLIKDLGEDDKNEADLLGIETDEDEDEEE
ncbi:MAG: tetratricopeptide repeat protein [Patescibacteria group bacterium]